jgi:hypothetical protein
MTAHISELTKQCAADAIEAKMVVLKGWATNGIPWKNKDDGSLLRNIDGECELDYFPTNISTFCDWDGSQNTTLIRTSTFAISKTNHSTLYRSHRDMQTSIKIICNSLMIKADEQRKKSNKTAIIGNLHDEVTFLRALVKVQENDITEAAINSADIEAKLLQKNRAIENLKEYYEVENQQLKKSVAELTATLQKLTPLRKEK